MRGTSSSPLIEFLLFLFNKVMDVLLPVPIFLNRSYI